MSERVNLPYQEQARFERIAIFFMLLKRLFFFVILLSGGFLKVTVEPVYEDVSS